MSDSELNDVCFGQNLIMLAWPQLSRNECEAYLFM